MKGDAIGYMNMQRLAIRDDDISFWTNPKDIIDVYGELLNSGISLSFAVIPESYRLCHPGNRKKFYVSKEKRMIYENRELIKFLTPFVKSGQIEIMLHGYDHSYYIELDKKIVFLDEDVRHTIGNIYPKKIIPELLFKDTKTIDQEILRGKKILEETFETTVNTFVPPSNAIKASAVKIVAKNGMNISGTITNRFNRSFDFYSISIFIKKILWKLRGNSFSYPYEMRYRRHSEITGFSFTPKTNIEHFLRSFDKCMSKNCDFTIATHYWELIENPILKKEYLKFISYALEKADSALLRDLFFRAD